MSNNTWKVSFIVCYVLLILSMLLNLFLIYRIDSFLKKEIQIPKEKPYKEVKPRPKLVSRGDFIDREKELTIRILNSVLKNKLENKGDVIYKACKSQTPEVSTKIMTAIILVEVGTDCNSRVLNECDNVGGLNWFDGCGYPKKGWYIDFSNHGGVDKSIEMKAKTLSNYINEGRYTIPSIGEKYAPTNDSRNGIGGMNNNSWVTNVTYWYDKLNSQYLHTL